MNIITGHTGTDHVTANAIQAFNQGLLGVENTVLNLGSKFAATLTDATHISIADGEGVMQGVHFRIERGQTETVTLDSGTSGSNRVDLICARYQKNSSTGVESVSLVVVKGTASSGTPTEPDITSGDIVGGDLVADFPLYKVTFTGVNISFERVFEIYGERKEVDLDYQTYPRYFFQEMLDMEAVEEKIGDYITLAKGRIYIIVMTAVAVGFPIDPVTIDMHVMDASDTVICGHSEYAFQTHSGDWNHTGILDLRNASEDAVIHGRIASAGNGGSGSGNLLINMAITTLRL